MELMTRNSILVSDDEEPLLSAIMPRADVTTTGGHDEVDQSVLNLLDLLSLTAIAP